MKRFKCKCDIRECIIDITEEIEYQPDKCVFHTDYEEYRRVKWKLVDYSIQDESMGKILNGIMVNNLFQYIIGSGKDGKQIKFMFPNNHGASLIADGYGSDNGEYEIAVIDKDFDLDYSTPITNDVLGYLTQKQVLETLHNIQMLPDTQEDALDRAMKIPLNSSISNKGRYNVS